MKIYVYRYMWRSSSDDEFKNKVCIKVVADTLEGLKSFESALISQYGDKLDSFAREYLHEYDVEKISIVDTLYRKEGEIYETF